MTSRERLLTAYRGGLPDRTPVAIRGVYPMNPEWVARKHESYRPLIEYVREHADLVELCGPRQSRCRFLTQLGDLPCGSETKDINADRTETVNWIETPAGPIREIAYYSKSQQLSMTHKHWVENAEDLRRFLSIPYLPTRPDLSEYFARRDALGERGICVPELPNAVYFVYELLGTEGLALWSRERRETVLELLHLFHARLLEHVTWLLDQGIGPVVAFLGEEVITPPMHSPRDFQEFVVPFDRPLVELLHARGLVARIHCHGRIGRLLDDFLEIGVDALHPVEEPPMGDVTLEAFRRKVGNRICVKGGVQIGDLYEKTHAEIAAHCQRVIQTAGAAGALILAPSASPYWPVLTPAMFDNYRAMIDSVHACAVVG